MGFFDLLFPDFSLILCGYFLCRYSALDRSVWEGVDKLVYFFFFPVLLFSAIVKQTLDWQATGPLLGAGLGLIGAGIALSYSLPHWPVLGARLDRRLHAASAQIGFRFNSFIALAVVERLLGTAALPLLALLIGVLVPLLNVAAVWPMARQAGGNVWRELGRNPLILATVGGMLANLLGVTLPHWLWPPVQRIGQGAIVLGLLAAGAGMRLTAVRQTPVLGVAVLGLKHLVFPLLAVAMVWLWDLPPFPAQVLLLFAAVPTATSCYVLAARMGHDGAYVASLVTLSTLLGTLSLAWSLGVLAPWVRGG